LWKKGNLTSFKQANEDKNQTWGEKDAQKGWTGGGQAIRVRDRLLEEILLLTLKIARGEGKKILVRPSGENV